MRWRGCRWPSRSRSPDRRVPRSREVAGAITACDEHLAVGQQRRRVTIACGGEAAGGRPGPARRIVEFRAREIAVVVAARLRRAPCRWAATSPCEIACGGEAAGGRPGPARRIVEFRARERAAACHTACDEHLAVGQQRRRVTSACGGEAAGGRPGPARRIVEFRARENAAAVMTACDEHLAVGQQRRRVNRVRCEAAGGRPGPARRIVEFRARESSRCCPDRLRRAPCRWAATSPCDHSVRWRGCRWPSRSRSPDRQSSALARAPPPLLSSCNEHLAVGQQRRRVAIACGCEAPVAGPGPARRIVEFRAREIVSAVITSGDKHLAVGEQCRRVKTSRGS